MTSQEEAILAQVDAQLNAMDAPSSAEVFYGLEEFSPRHQVAAAARVAKAGGGSGGNVPFVGDDPPASPIDGMLWWDPDDDTPASGSSQPVKIVDWQFTQTSGDGTYTASFDLPANSLILAIGMQTTAEWDVDPDGAPLLIGDDDAADTYFTGSAQSVVGFFWTDFGATIAGSDAWLFSESGTTITGSLTTTGSVGTTGRTRVVILYASAVPVVDATKVDAP